MKLPWKVYLNVLSASSLLASFAHYLSLV